MEVTVSDTRSPKIDELRNWIDKDYLPTTYPQPELAGTPISGDELEVVVVCNGVTLEKLEKWRVHSREDVHYLRNDFRSHPQHHGAAQKTNSH